MIYSAAVGIMALCTRDLIKDDMRLVRIKAVIVEDARSVMAQIAEGVCVGTLRSGGPVIVQFQDGCIYRTMGAWRSRKVVISVAARAFYQGRGRVAPCETRLKSAFSITLHRMKGRIGGREL